MAQFETRLKLVELDPDAVERWVDHKKSTVGIQLLGRQLRARRTGGALNSEILCEVL